MAESSPQFPATIAIINDYVTGDVDAPTTAAKLAKPIEQAYSTADHGVARYNEEMAARNQRTHWSPEEAFEKVMSMSPSALWPKQVPKPFVSSWYNWAPFMLICPSGDPNRMFLSLVPR
jgi:hypothetical protein